MGKSKKWQPNHQPVKSSATVIRCFSLGKPMGFSQTFAGGSPSHHTVGISHDSWEVESTPFPDNMDIIHVGEVKYQHY